MKKSLFERMGGTYHQEGDHFIPDLVPPENITVGIWGQRRKQYLREHRKPFYTALFLSGKLEAHLTEIDQQAESMFFQLVNQMAEQECITEKFKAKNQMEWVGQMNNIRAVAVEIINEEILLK